MSRAAITAQTLLCQLQLLSFSLEIEAMTGLELATEPWQEYTAEDYDTPEAFCSSCLVDLNPDRQYKRDAKLCSLPIKAPRKSKVIYLEALRLAEEFLVNPKNELAFGDRIVRIRTAETLVSLLQQFGQIPNPALVELSQSE